MGTSRDTTKQAHSAVIFDLLPSQLRAYLVDECDGRGRFVARGQSQLIGTAAESLADDALAALAELERLTGRTLVLRSSPLTPCGPDGSGVDALLAVCAPPGQLRVAIVGTDAAQTNDGAARAVETAGHAVAFVASLDAEGIGTPPGIYEAVRLLWRATPDVVVVTVRNDPRSDKVLGQLGAALGASCVEGESAPLLLFAGPAARREPFDGGLKGRLLARTVPELYPEPGRESLEPLKLALAAFHVEKWCERLPDWPRVRSWLTARPVSRDAATFSAIRFLTAAFLGPAWLLDCEAPDVLAGGAMSDVTTYCRLLRQVEERECVAWLPEGVPIVGAREAYFNHQQRPSTQAGDRVEGQWRQAVVRAVCQSLHADPRQPLTLPQPAAAAGHVVLVGGADCLAGGGEAAQLLLDTLRPAGAGYLHWDELALLPALGALGELAPQLAVEVLIADALRPLGSFVAPSGQVRSGAEAVTLEATFADRETLRLEVAASEIQRLGVPRAMVPVLRGRPVGALDLGAGRGKPVTLESLASPLGVVVDSRGRPLPALSEEERRRAAAAARLRLGCAPWSEVER